jgi:hypothetical protein
MGFKSVQIGKSNRACNYMDVSWALLFEGVRPRVDNRGIVLLSRSGLGFSAVGEE